MNTPRLIKTRELSDALGYTGDRIATLLKERFGSCVLTRIDGVTYLKLNINLQIHLLNLPKRKRFVYQNLMKLLIESSNVIDLKETAKLLEIRYDAEAVVRRYHEHPQARITLKDRRLIRAKQNLGNIRKVILIE